MRAMPHFRVKKQHGTSWCADVLGTFRISGSVLAWWRFEKVSKLQGFDSALLGKQELARCVSSIYGIR